MAEAPLIGTRDIAHDGPVIRLLFCFECNTVDELPPFEGPPEHDYLLEMTAEKHEYPSGERHKGKLFILPVKTWAHVDSRKAIIEQLKGAGARGLDALTPDGDYYSTRMTFADDAMDCWKRHLRPGDGASAGCNDYETPPKRLLPTTVKERREAGLPDPANAPGPKVYLCHFCPFHSVVMTKKRSMRGMYDA